MDGADEGRRAFLRTALAGIAVVGVGCVPRGARAEDDRCELTEPNIEGPYYRAGAPWREHLSAQGQRLIVAGTVHTCGRPLAGAELDVWQANPNGDYDLAGYGLRARMHTHRDGTYRIETVVPGHYLNGDNYRPAHIHVKVRARNRPELTTQLYFEGDPYNAIDPWFRPALILRPRPSGGVLRAHFDFDV